MASKVLSINDQVRRGFELGREGFENLWSTEKICPVEILKVVNVNGKPVLQLDEEALKNIVARPDIEHMPIMVLSVCGAFRKGKSFLLSLLLRYLKKKGYENPNWLGKDDIKDGFHWRGGHEPHTQGILLLDQPIIVKDCNEREIAVFLMDTQGLFDTVTDKTVDVQIFAFSTLLSSVQVFNLFHQIQEDNLEYLHFFTAYAKKAADSKTKATGPPFQKLIFLIRDWHDPSHHEYGVDDKKEGYLSGILNRKSKTKTVSNVQQNLEQSFNEMGCFMMPYPGTKVAVSRREKKFEGEVEAIESEFIEYVSMFANSVLNPAALIPKKINGREITGNDLVNYALDCCQKFQSGSLPEPISMMQSASITACLQSIQICVDEYDESMIEFCKSFVEDLKFSKKEKEEAEKTHRKFIEETDFANDEIKDKYMKHLKRTLDNRQKIYREENECQRNKLRVEMTMEIPTIVEEYRKCMKEASRNSGSIFNVEQSHDVVSTNIVNSFVEKFKAYPEFDFHKKKLDSDISYAFKRMERDLNWNRYIDWQKRDVLQVCCDDYDESFKKIDWQKRDVLQVCCDDYDESFKKFDGKYVNENILKQTNKNAMKDLLAKFEETCGDKGIKQASRKELEQLLMKQLQEKFQDIKRSNIRAKEDLDVLADKEITSLATTYGVAMAKGMDGSYAPPDVLHQAHKKNLEIFSKQLETESAITAKCSDKEALQNIKIKLVNVINVKYDDIKKTNQENKSSVKQTTASSQSFLAKAGLITAGIIAAPILVAVGLPVLAVYSVFKGIGKLFKKK